MTSPSERPPAPSNPPRRSPKSAGHATLQPRFGPIASMLGYAAATVGFGMVIYPHWPSLTAYLILGLVVGAIVQLARPFPALTPILPVMAAMVVTILATWFLADTAHDGLLRVVTPALVAMLPGISLTVAAVELAGGQIVSGASRLVYAIAQQLASKVMPDRHTGFAGAALVVPFAMLAARVKTSPPPT